MTHVLYVLLFAVSFLCNPVDIVESMLWTILMSMGQKKLMSSTLLLDMLSNIGLSQGNPGFHFPLLPKIIFDPL